MDLFMDLITTTSELAAACDRFARHPASRRYRIPAGNDLLPLLCVVQIASPDEAVVIDTLAAGIDLKSFSS